MKPSTLLLGLLAFGVSQTPCSRPSKEIEEGDVLSVSASSSAGSSECAPGSQNADGSCPGEDAAVLLQRSLQHDVEQESHSLPMAVKTFPGRGDAGAVDKKHARDLAATDTNAFTAANVVVKPGGEDTSDSIIEGGLKRLEQETSDLVSNKAGDADIKDLDKPEDLGNSLEQKDVTEANFLQAALLRAEAYVDCDHKICKGPVALLRIGLLLPLTAFIVICLYGNTQKSQRGAYEQFVFAEQCDVWEQRAVECPHKARETRITVLFHEIRGPAAEASITASELHDLMRDPRVAKEFADIGVQNFHDAMPAYKMLASKSSDGVSVNIMEFVSVSTTPEGHLLQLFTELDEANKCEDSPPGFVNEEDLHRMMSKPRVKAMFTSLGLSLEDAFTTFRVIEAQSGNGRVAIEEFIPGCTKMKAQNRGQMTRSCSARSGSSNGGRASVGGVI